MLKKSLNYSFISENEYIHLCLLYELKIKLKLILD